MRVQVLLLRCLAPRATAEPERKLGSLGTMVLCRMRACGNIKMRSSVRATCRCSSTIGTNWKPWVHVASLSAAAGSDSCSTCEAGLPTRLEQADQRERVSSVLPAWTAVNPAWQEKIWRFRTYLGLYSLSETGSRRAPAGTTKKASQQP
jgi:hypothetical protein